MHECVLLSGIDRTTVVPTCVKDPAVPGDYKCNFTCPGGGSANCIDADLDWSTGCEVATNQDTDVEGVFMNEGDAMDCAVMQDEAEKNPALFRHHLHIDLTKPMDTTISGKTLAPGTIICNNQLAASYISGGLNGKCVFMCVDGFDNVDRNAYNGCEEVNGTTLYPYVYGGYWIGDPLVEAYLDFLCTTSGNTLYTDEITFAYNVCHFRDRISEYWGEYPLWY